MSMNREQTTSFGVRVIAMIRQVRSGMQKENNQQPKSTFNHVWFWKARLPERKGQPCKVIARGKMKSILVEFEDGFRVVTSRYAVRQNRISSNHFL
jgi:hypothetical protein